MSTTRRPALVLACLLLTGSFLTVNGAVAATAPPTTGDRRATAPAGALRPDRAPTLWPGMPGASALTQTPELLSLAQAVSNDSLFADVVHVSADYATRYTRAEEYEIAAAWGLDALAAAGLDDVHFDEFNLGGYLRHNVVGIKYGTTAPSEIVLIGGHLDSTSEDPWNLAPGAEDNGSGAVAVLEMARLLAPVATERTLYFVLFGGEEQGLVGSSAFAQRAAQQGLDIVGALILDMVGYNDPAGVDLWLEGFHTIPSSMWLVDLVAEKAVTYAGLTVYIYPGDGWGSDHEPFHDYGYSSMLSIENEWDSYPCYHRTCDTASRIDAAFLGRITIANATAALDLAGPDFTPATVSGTVDLADTGDDSGSTVTVLGTLYPPAVTALDGSYSLPGLLPGSYTLRAEHEGYEPSTTEGVVVTSGATVEVDFMLLPTGTGIAGGEPAPAAPALAVGPAAPSPFRIDTSIPYSLPAAGPVWLRIYDAQGRVVRQLVGGEYRTAGAHAVRWDGRDGRGRETAAGVFWVEVKGPDSSAGTRAGVSARTPIVRLR